MAAKRIQISMQEDTLEKLDKMAKEKGYTRSGIISSLVNQAAFTEELTAAQILDVIENDERFAEVIKTLAAS